MNIIQKILRISQKSIMRKTQPVVKSNVNMPRKERIKTIQTKINAKEYPVSKKRLKRDRFTFVFLVIVAYLEGPL